MRKNDKLNFAIPIRQRVPEVGKNGFPRPAINKNLLAVVGLDECRIALTHVKKNNLDCFPRANREYCVPYKKSDSGQEKQ